MQSEMKRNTVRTIFCPNHAPDSSRVLYHLYTLQALELSTTFSLSPSGKKRIGWMSTRPCCRCGHRQMRWARVWRRGTPHYHRRRRPMAVPCTAGIASRAQNPPPTPASPISPSSVSHPRPVRSFPFSLSSSIPFLSLSSDLHLAPLPVSTLFFGSGSVQRFKFSNALHSLIGKIQPKYLLSKIASTSRSLRSEPYRSS
jgi:hypothetical protein